MKQTKLLHFGNENYVNIEKTKETCLKRYGVDSFSKTEKFRTIWHNEELLKTTNEKKYLTHKKNHSFKQSKHEECCYRLLEEKFPSVIRQYRFEKYPFNCDFYIPELDLYIEFNGTWTHGKHPFDENNKEDQEVLEKWKAKNTKFYNNAIENWTKRDVEKREVAKRNGLNFVEFWNLEEAKNWLEEQKRK